MDFDQRAARLPYLGFGLSTEYGAAAAPGAVDPLALRAARPRYAAFLEVGLELHKGLDDAARAWLAAGAPTTYHFLDVNLDAPLERAWLHGATAALATLKPAWVCGDAGWWYWGAREPAQMLLLPPVLTVEAADALADGIVAAREALGVEVVPENPPGLVWLGDVHLLDFWARVLDRADCGMLLDVAHLGMYQRMTGRQPLDGLDGFPLERVLELHVAGGTEREHDGLPWVDDDHGLGVLPDTWALVDAVVPRAARLQAIVLEAERNDLAGVLTLFEALDRRVAGTPFARGLP